MNCLFAGLGLDPVRADRMDFAPDGDSVAVGLRVSQLGFKFTQFLFSMVSPIQFASPFDHMPDPVLVYSILTIRIL